MCLRVDHNIIDAKNNNNDIIMGDYILLEKQNTCSYVFTTY